MPARVTVIVTVYNGEEYLRQCLDSIVAQDYSDFEALVVDDGSTDSSPAICDEYASRYPNMRVIHTPNRGVSAARNLGVEETKGQLIAFVDADDTLHPQFLTTMARLIDDNHAAAAACDFTDCESDMTDQGKIATFTPRQAIERTLYQRGLNPSVWAKLLPRKALLAAPQTPGIRYEDLDVSHRIYENLDGYLVATTAKMYYYRQNPRSFINNFTPERLDVLKVVDNIERHYSSDPQMLPAASDRRFSAYYNMFILTSKAGDYATADACWQVVKSYRAREIANGKIRLKNRIGALVSYLGKQFVRAISCISTR